MRTILGRVSSGGTIAACGWEAFHEGFFNQFVLFYLFLVFHEMENIQAVGAEWVMRVSIGHLTVMQPPTRYLIAFYC